MRRASVTSRSARWQRWSKSATTPASSTPARCRSGRSPGSTPERWRRRDGKTRGAITNLFGSQAAYQVETMGMTLDARRDRRAGRLARPGRFRRCRGVGRGAVRRPVGARAEARGGARHVLCVALGALARHRALRPLERARRRAVDGRVRPAGGAARDDLRGRPGALRADAPRGRGPGGPRLRRRQPDRGRLAQPVPDRRHPRVADAPISATLVRAGRMLWRGAVAP